MTDDRPRCYITHAVIVAGWPALFLGMPRVRRALQAELDDLPHRLPHAEVVAVLEACHQAGQAWIAARNRQSEAVQTEAEVSSEHGDELTTSEAASVMNRSPRRILQLVQAGKLPARRVGGRWRFSLVDIEGRLQHGE